jgi:hypothetical protein
MLIERVPALVLGFCRTQRLGFPFCQMRTICSVTATERRRRSTPRRRSPTSSLQRMPVSAAV